VIQVKYEEIARSIIRDSMKLGEDDFLWIQTGDHNLRFAEEVAIEAWKIGAYPLLEVSSDYYRKRMFEETPEKFLKKPRRHLADAWEKITALLYIENEKDPALLESISPGKKASARVAELTANRILMKNNTRIAIVLYPMPEMAKAYNVGWEEYHDRVWGAIRVDPEELYRIGKPIKEFLNRGREVHITSEKGTDLRFSIEGRGAVICNGQELEENYEICRYNLNIPAGEVFITIVEDSANGVAVFDKVFVGGAPVEDLRLEFKNGSVVSFDAAGNREKFEKFYETLTPADKLSAEFGIGTNYMIREVIGCPHTDEKIAGTIHIAIGASIMYGGKNEAPVHFDMIMPAPTVHLDGKLMMNRGDLVIQN